MEIHLKIIGFLLLALSAIHLPFPTYFKWKTELQSLNLMNKQMMYVHTFFVVLIIVLMALLCIFCSHDLLYTHLGRQIGFGLFIFWGIRLVFQLFVYSPKLWKGKLFETSIHILFSLLWAYITIVFYMASCTIIHECKPGI
ncbi:MAG TPA: hypothetical protein VK783_12695 [Bacteroidia bacterium]|jgi:hypothetical protein|nr:hypothetical protein [Bacteroidia bacterium]